MENGTACEQFTISHPGEICCVICGEPFKKHQQLELKQEDGSKVPAEQKINWKKPPNKQHGGELGYRGELSQWLFQWYYDATLPQSSKDLARYRLECCLPGVKQNLGNFVTPEECKARAERMFVHFCMRAHLVIPKGVC